MSRSRAVGLGALRRRGMGPYPAAMTARALGDGRRGAMVGGASPAGGPEVIAWALMAVGEMLGMRWLLWNGTTEMPPAVLAELDKLIGRMLEP